MSMAISQSYGGRPLFYSTARGQHGDICWMLIAAVAQTGPPQLCVARLFQSCMLLYVCRCCRPHCMNANYSTQLRASCSGPKSPSNLMFCLTVPGLEWLCCVCWSDPEGGRVCKLCYSLPSKFVRWTLAHFQEMNKTLNGKEQHP